MASRAFGFLAPRGGQPQSFLGFSFQQVPRIQTEPWTCPWSKPPNLISLVFLVSTYIIIYLQHISTHIAEFLYISLHTSIPQSFIIVCPSSPPYNQKLCKNQQPSKFMVPWEGPQPSSLYTSHFAFMGSWGCGHRPRCLSQRGHQRVQSLFSVFKVTGKIHGGVWYLHVYHVVARIWPDGSGVPSFIF
jgi:hypothetical protein